MPFILSYLYFTMKKNTTFFINDIKQFASRACLFWYKFPDKKLWLTLIFNYEDNRRIVLINDIPYYSFSDFIKSIDNKIIFISNKKLISVTFEYYPIFINIPLYSKIYNYIYNRYYMNLVTALFILYSSILAIYFIDDTFYDYSLLLSNYWNDDFIRISVENPLVINPLIGADILTSDESEFLFEDLSPDLNNVYFFDIIKELLGLFLIKNVYFPSYFQESTIPKVIDYTSSIERINTRDLIFVNRIILANIINYVNDNLANLTYNLNRTNHNLLQLRGENLLLIENIANIRQNHESLRIQNNNYIQEIALLSHRNRILNNDIITMNDRIATVCIERNSLRTQLNELRLANMFGEDKINWILQIDSLTVEKNLLENSFEIVNNEHAALLDSVNALLDYENNIRNENLVLQHNIDLLTSERNSLRNNYQRLESKLRNILIENRNLRNENHTWMIKYYQCRIDLAHEILKRY